MSADSMERAKRAAGAAAAASVRDGMTLGLGTGSTARWFIEAVAGLVREGMRLRGVPTSRASEELARELGIPVVELPAAGVDLAVDGADSVDGDLRLIKGAGGAMVREKVVAAAAARFVVVVDESKVHERLTGVLPCEVLAFGHASTLAAIERVCHATPRLRGAAGLPPYRTDNGNLVADVPLDAGVPEPEALAELLDAIPGVLGHGLFLGMADLVIVARADGGIARLTAPGGPPS